MHNLNRFSIYIVTLVILMMMLTVTSAQATGQFCVRSFDDRNGNGIRDAGEVTLQNGVVAELSDASNVVIASALLSDSPTASQGIICFENLSSGQYTIVVTSGDFLATTPNALTVTIQEGDLPAVMEFGAQKLNIEPQPVDTVTDVISPEQQLEQILVATLGALIAAIIMVILGIIIYLLFFRGKGGNKRNRNMDYLPPSDDVYQRPDA